VLSRTNLSQETAAAETRNRFVRTLAAASRSKKALSEPHRNWWATQVKAAADVTLVELQERVAKEKRATVSPATGCRALRELRCRVKKGAAGG